LEIAVRVGKNIELKRCSINEERIVNTMDGEDKKKRQISDAVFKTLKLIESSNRIWRIMKEISFVIKEDSSQRTLGGVDINDKDRMERENEFWSSYGMEVKWERTFVGSAIENEFEESKLLQIS